jgi:N-methylhydantoinase A/oxoprolinase/acetone carboxylase beta subunit
VDIALKVGGDPGDVETAVEDMRKEAERDMRGEGFSREAFVFGLELLVAPENGGEEIKLEADSDFFKHPDKIADLLARAGVSPSGTLKLNTVSLRVRAPVAHFEIKPGVKGNGDAQSAQKSLRPVFMGTQYREVPVYEREKLVYGHDVRGPALVESAHTTVYVSTGWKMTIDTFNNAVLEGEGI